MSHSEPTPDHSDLAAAVAAFLAARVRLGAAPDSVSADFGLDAERKPAVHVTTWQDGEITGRATVPISA